MTYATGTFTDAADLLSKLSTFASTTITTTWTVDDAVGSDKFAMHLGTSYVSFRYDSSAAVADAQVISIHQATGHTGAALPGDHPDDSGSGYNSTSAVAATNLDDGRHANVSRDSTNTPNTYHFFEDDTDDSYIHVIVVKEDREHVHFGFGHFKKFGSWTGGSYAYGQFIGATNSIDPYDSSDLYVSLDGRANGVSTSSGVRVGHYATIHVEGFADEDAASKWGEISLDTGDAGTDSASNTRMKVQGGYRGGLVCNSLAPFPVGKTNGFYNLVPICLFSYFSAFDPSRIHYMGMMHDVRCVVLDGLAPGAEITEGADTWMVFPSFKKDGDGISSRSTLYQGLAYKKIV